MISSVKATLASLIAFVVLFTLCTGWIVHVLVLRQMSDQFAIDNQWDEIRSLRRVQNRHSMYQDVLISDIWTLEGFICRNTHCDAMEMMRLSALLSKNMDRYQEECSELDKVGAFQFLSNHPDRVGVIQGNETK